MKIDRTKEADMDPKALYKIGYGMYIIGAHKGEKINAQIANTVFQISSEPPTLAVSINKKNLTHEYIRESRAYAAAVLNIDTPLSFIGQFGFKSGRDINKFEGVNFKKGITGSPIVLDNAVSYLEVKVTQEIDAGTHSIFIGQVVEGEILSDKQTLTYEYYQQVKRGTTPKTAPSYVEVKKEAPAAPPPAAKYKCQVCGYIYDPAAGDPDSGIKPGTPFEALPDNWTCPVCGAEKAEFKKVE
jgi:flavin reductase (DIM6/NTAB) family NADH-FMN oxidoreductase RutF/rubredoxin